VLKLLFAASVSHLRQIYACCLGLVLHMCLQFLVRLQCVAVTLQMQELQRGQGADHRSNA
jgi:hypothetical protein